MKKIILNLIVVVLLFSGVISFLVISRLDFGAARNSWVCVSGEWVKYGNPAGEPNGECGEIKKALDPCLKSDLASQNECQRVLDNRLKIEKYFASHYSKMIKDKKAIEIKNALPYSIAWIDGYIANLVFSSPDKDFLAIGEFTIDDKLGLEPIIGLKSWQVTAIKEIKSPFYARVKIAKDSQNPQSGQSYISYDTNDGLKYSLMQFLPESDCRVGFSKADCFKLFESSGQHAVFRGEIIDGKAMVKSVNVEL